MINPQDEVEKFITEVHSRNACTGIEISQRLRLIQECVGEGERADQKEITNWLSEIKNDESYSSSRVVTKLLDLWALIRDNLIVVV